MNEEEYISQRLDEQISWYDKKSQWNQRWYKRLKATEIFMAILIPFLVGYIAETAPGVKFAVGFLSVIVAAIAGLVSLYKFQENWIEYRTTVESLKHEKYLYLTKTGPYDGADVFNKLVENVEGLISKENTRWAQHTKKQKKEGENG